MIKRAGIALGRLTYDSEFSITQIDRGFGFGPTFLPPTHHKLVDGHSVDEIFDIFHDTIGVDAKIGDNELVVSYPIVASHEQARALSRLADSRPVYDHFFAWLNAYAYNYPKDEKGINVLFVDLTPGQVASKATMNANIRKQKWFHLFHKLYTHQCGDDDSLSTHELFDKLVRSVQYSGRELNLVGILRPEGAFPDLSNTDIESKFPGVPVKWVTLDDISYGAAIMTTYLPTAKWILMQRRTKLAIGIKLINDDLVTVMPEGQVFPTTRKFLLTTSQDDQTTATVQLYLGAIPWVNVTLQGLVRKPRGQTTIKTTLEIDISTNANLKVEEIGTDLKVTKDLGITLHLYAPRTNDKEENEESADEQMEMTLGKDGIIGELPE
jgi:hypothetical protein